MPELDFTGLGEAAQAAFKPHFAEVVRREARRRRKVRMAGAAVAAAAVAVGGTAVGLSRSGQPQFAAPPFDPYRTPDFIGPPEGTPPPGEDPAHKTRGGPVVAGDLEHLYARWQHCRAKDCELMVAASADGGATWHSYPLPVGHNAMVDLRAVAPRTLVAWDQAATDGTMPTQSWHASIDGGATWRELHPRTVDTLPAGWRVLDDFDFLRPGAVTAIDPATGDVAALAPRPLEMAKAVGGLPPAAGLWVSGYLGTTVTPETDPASDGENDRIIGTGSAVEVSTDGGRTWHRYVFPEELVAAESAPGAAAIATEDGRTVYAVGRVGKVLRVYRSSDDGHSWQRTAAHAEVGARPIRAAMGANGRLVIQAGPEGDEGVLMFDSVDGGATVRPIPAGPGASASRVIDGYVQTGGPWSNGVWLSTDGERWAFVDSPEVP